MHERLAEELSKRILGLTVSAAKAIHRNIRVVKEDGIERILTMDLDLDRINVEVEDDVIINVIDQG